MSSKAFAPGNLSCLFQIIDNNNPLKKHSLGVGFTVNKGVTVSVKKSFQNKIFFNKKLIHFPTVLTVKNDLVKQKKIRIDIHSALPLGCGFGISGASALATAYALSKEFRLKKSKKQLALIAHYAEVQNHTGLGDVGGQFNGGFMIKYKKGQPLYVEQIPVREKTIYYQVFSRLDTKKVITNNEIKNKINTSGHKALKKILALKRAKKIILLKEIILISKEFATNSGLLKKRKVISCIRDIEKNHGHASMIMLGNAVFSDKWFKGSKKLQITRQSAHVI